MQSRSRGVPGFLLSALFVSALFIVPAYAQAAEWHIADNATGGDCISIGAWDAPIKTCTLTQDLNQGVIIDNDNVILDGNGHTTAGSNAGNGVFLLGRIGVTVKNLNVKNFAIGIYLESSSNNTLTGSVVSNNFSCGICLHTSNNNTLTDNTASNNVPNAGGIQLVFSSNNTLTGNTESSNNIGILLSDYSNNTLTSNIAQENNRSDIYVLASSDSDCNNNITDTTGSGGRPIKYFSGEVNLNNETLSELILCNADNSNITDITIDGSATKQNNGLLLVWTDSSTITNVNSSNNFYGINLASSNNNTLTGNTASNNINAGILLQASNENTLTSNTASNNAQEGIFLISSSNNNALTGNTVSGNFNTGIRIDISSSNNTLTGNTVSHNDFNKGIFVISSSNNQIYRNNLISNSPQASVTTDSNGNVFNLASPIGGNYWSDFDTTAEGCNDANGDNFCDAPYTFTGGQDNLPWTTQDRWLDPATTTPSTERQITNDSNYQRFPAIYGN